MLIVASRSDGLFELITSQLRSMHKPVYMAVKSLRHAVTDAPMVASELDCTVYHVSRVGIQLYTPYVDRERLIGSLAW